MNFSLKNRIVFLCFIMLITFCMAFILKPSKKMSVDGNKTQYNALIPNTFAGWRVDTSNQVALVDPEVKDAVASVYSQVVSRTYINGHGDRVMLTIAYGGDQEEVMQVHKPEVCYTAQGFTVNKNGIVPIDTDKGTVHALQLIAKQAGRVEPVTYWITIGNSIALNGLAWRWERIKYGLTGTLPDGLLFRVSSIGSDVNHEYQIQQQFIKSLISNLSLHDAKQLMGTIKVN